MIESTRNINISAYLQLLLIVCIESVILPRDIELLLVELHIGKFLNSDIIVEWGDLYLRVFPQNIGEVNYSDNQKVDGEHKKQDQGIEPITSWQ